jgi:tryptophanyl-tRNA synthetase
MPTTLTLRSPRRDHRPSADRAAHLRLQTDRSIAPGNYLGAIRPMLDASGRTDSTVMIADLHALTVEHDPARLRSLTAELLATLVACGIDPGPTPIYVQSDVPEHAELHYLLECATGTARPPG